MNRKETGEMKKWRVYALYTASKYLGEFEAETEEAALDMAESDGDTYVSLCHQCAGEIDLGDAYKFEAEEADPTK